MLGGELCKIAVLLTVGAAVVGCGGSSPSTPQPVTAESVVAATPEGEVSATPGGETAATPGGEAPGAPRGEAAATPESEAPAAPGGEAAANPGGETAGLPRAGGAKLDSANHPDWMAALPDDRPLSRVSLPGTHDTMAFHGGRAGPAVVTQESFGTGCRADDCVSRQSLRVQLNAGVRALDVRVRRDETDGLAIQHGPFFQHATLDDVLGVIEDFLAGHPLETVLIRLKAECVAAPSSFGCTDAAGVAPDLARVDRSLAAHPRIWQPSAVGHAGIPTLREVRGRIVFTQFTAFAQGDDRGLPVDAQDLWDGPDMDVKWAAIATHLDRTATATPDTLYVNYLSANGTPDPTKLPRRYATIQNQHTLDHLRTHPQAPTGILMMDFPTPDLLTEILRHNTG
ncbi:phosphatidylinositol-specific phospholipase C [Nocardia blacklockiae]|uniref:phosphatidylinositol-specific phospholipase C n=1 Tax=Nocardia blacklockiae TaxID=480036 RepID=UPI001894DDE2|nr:phosphatidylinositol-specific phospholipase C [Nocardia blacklockiae]